MPSRLSRNHIVLGGTGESNCCEYCCVCGDSRADAHDAKRFCSPGRSGLITLSRMNLSLRSTTKSLKFQQASETNRRTIDMTLGYPTDRGALTQLIRMISYLTVKTYRQGSVWPLAKGRARHEDTVSEHAGFQDIQVTTRRALQVTAVVRAVLLPKIERTSAPTLLLTMLLLPELP